MFKHTLPIAAALITVSSAIAFAQTPSPQPANSANSQSSAASGAQASAGTYDPRIAEQQLQTMRSLLGLRRAQLQATTADFNKDIQQLEQQISQLEAQQKSGQPQAQNPPPGTASAAVSHNGQTSPAAGQNANGRNTNGQSNTSGR